MDLVNHIICVHLLILSSVQLFLWKRHLNFFESLFYYFFGDLPPDDHFRFDEWFFFSTLLYYTDTYCSLRSFLNSISCPPKQFLPSFHHENWNQRSGKTSCAPPHRVCQLRGDAHRRGNGRDICFILYIYKKSALSISFSRGLSVSLLDWPISCDRIERRPIVITSFVQLHDPVKLV